MTDKQLLQQFDALSKEWFGTNGYSEIKRTDHAPEGRDFRIIHRCGLADWKVADDVDEQGIPQGLFLCALDGNIPNSLSVALYDTNANSPKPVFWAILSLLSKYFNVYYSESESSDKFYFFHIKNIVYTL